MSSSSDSHSQRERHSISSAESSRASQLSGASNYSYEELARQIFYKPDGEDETARALPEVLSDEWQAPPSISQALGTALPDNVAEGSGNGGITTNRWRTSQASTSSSVTPQRSSFHYPSTALFPHDEDPEDTQPPTPPTTPTRASYLGTQLPPQTEEDEQGAEVNIPDANTYPRVKLSPPPKRKSISPSSSPSPSSPPAPPPPPTPTSAFPMLPPAAPQRPISAPVILSPTPRTPSRHVRFLSSLPFDLIHTSRTHGSGSASSTPTPTPTRPFPPPVRSPKVERTMFIVGFLFPWCWLIGGWLLPLTRNRIASQALPTHENAGEGAGVTAHGRSYSLTVSTRPSSRQRTRWGRRCRVAATVAAVVIASVCAVAIWVAVMR